MMITFLDPKDSGRFKEGVVWYTGRRYRVALFMLGDRKMQLSLADTYRCVQSADVARTVLENMARGAGVSVPLNGAAVELMAHCRLITGWKEPDPPR